MHPDGVLAPGLHYDATAIIVYLQAGARPHGDLSVGLLGQRQRGERRESGEHRCLGSFLGAGAGDGRRLAQQLQLAPHRIGQVMVQVRAARIGGERSARLYDRAVDDRQVVPDDANRRGVEPPAAAA